MKMCRLMMWGVALFVMGMLVWPAADALASIGDGSGVILGLEPGRDTAKMPRRMSDFLVLLGLAGVGIAGVVGAVLIEGKKAEKKLAGKS